MAKHTRLDNTALLANICADSDSDGSYHSESESESLSQRVITLDDHVPLNRLVQNPGLVDVPMDDPDDSDQDLPLPRNRGAGDWVWEPIPSTLVSGVFFFMIHILIL